MMGVVRSMLLRSGDELAAAGVLNQTATSSSLIWRSWKGWLRLNWLEVEALAEFWGGG